MASGLLIFVVVAVVLGAAAAVVYSKFSPYLYSQRRFKQSSKTRIGRSVAGGHKGMAVFIIGVEIHKLYRVDLWYPVIRAMAEMLRVLQAPGADEELGFYGNTTYGILGAPFWPTMQVTYWKSKEAVLAFSAGDKHLGPMARLAAAQRKSKGAVGVYHELYDVAAMECVYVDMSPWALGAALGVQKATPGEKRSANRFDGCPEAPMPSIKPSSSATVVPAADE